MVFSGSTRESVFADPSSAARRIQGVLPPRSPDDPLSATPRPDAGLDLPAGRPAHWADRHPIVSQFRRRRSSSVTPISASDADRSAVAKSLAFGPLRESRSAVPSARRPTRRRPAILLRQSRNIPGAGQFAERRGARRGPTGLRRAWFLQLSSSTNLFNRRTRSNNTPAARRENRRPSLRGSVAARPRP